MCIYCANINSHSGTFFNAAGQSKLGTLSGNGKAVYPTASYTQYFNGDISIQETNNGVLYNTGNVLIDALANWVWNSSVGQPANLTFNFSEYTGGQYTTFDLTDTDKNWAREAFKAAERVADITLTEVPSNGASNADIPVSGAIMPGPVAGVTYIHSSNGIISWAPVQIDEPYVLPQQEAEPGTFGFSIFLHEFGHALGLKHPFDGTPTLPSSQQHMDYTVMTYGDGNYVMREDPTGFQYADVLAFQFLYGVGVHNAGDTTYTFSEYTVETIVDTGGHDVIYLGDVVTAGVTLNLGNGGPDEGHWNIINHGNGDTSVFNFSDGTVIEDVIGGTGNDAIDGNESANFMYGHGGSDTLKGKEGNDTIVGGRSLNDAQDGFDLIYGNDGDDIMFGNSGGDTLYGGNAEVDATDNSDTLYGGLGNDKLYGNGGDDWLIGGSGHDTIYGGNGDDIAIIGWGNESDIIIGFTGAGDPNEGDQIRIMTNVNNSGLTHASQLASRMTTDGFHTWLDLSNAQGYGGGVLIAWHTPDQFDLSQNTVTSDFFITDNVFI